MKRNQTGLSSITLLLVLLAGAFILLAGFKIVPLYLDNYFVKSSIDSLQDEDIRKMSDRQIRNALGRYFTINGVRDIKVDQLKIERATDKVVVKLDYEKRIDFIANIDVVVSFENWFDTSEYR